MNWKKMLLFCLVAGMLSTMNMMIFNVDDLRVHINDVYMIGLMTSWMILLMALFDEHRSYDIAIICLIAVIVIFYLMRTQTFVTDLQFIQGMIPHHSMAITMAQRILNKTQNDTIKLLAQNIISNQEAEIMQMKQIERSI